MFRGALCEMFNRFKLGRTLDEIQAYGCDLLFSELAVAVCTQEGIALRFNHLDTTSFALTGEYVPDSDEQAMTITHGHSKDYRPDLKQAVLELLVSQDGGVPLVSQRWDGHASDTEMFQERAAACSRLSKSPTPRYWGGLQTVPADNAANLLAMALSRGFPTRSTGIAGDLAALRWDTWQRLDAARALSRVELATTAWPNGGGGLFGCRCAARRGDRHQSAAA